MNAGMRRLLDRPDRPLDVALFRARETEYDRVRHGVRHSHDRIEVPLRGCCETRLNDVHRQLLELPCYRDLFLDIHRGTRRLLAIAQRGVEYLHPVSIDRVHDPSPRFRSHKQKIPRDAVAPAGI